MPFDNLREMLSHTSPSFRCCCSGDRTEQLGFTAGLRHILGQPETPMALAQIDSQLGDASMAIRDLYARHIVAMVCWRFSGRIMKRRTLNFIKFAVRNRVVDQIPFIDASSYDIESKLLTSSDSSKLYLSHALSLFGSLVESWFS